MITREIINLTNTTRLPSGWGMAAYIYLYVYIYIYTRGMSKLSSDRLHFAREGHKTVARGHSYFANIPEGVRYVLFAVASSSSKLELSKDG
jgi:hypothetical protein